MMKPSKINTFLLLKLPSAYICGVRVKKIENDWCLTSVRHRWINQNPFGSLFWAVQGMAAELATGALMIQKIKQSERDIAMLLIKNEASYSKKARGRIYFKCTDGALIDKALKSTIESGVGHSVTLNVIGRNADDIETSRFSFTWSMKLRK